MTTISQDQVLDRWGTLPDVLREAIVSEANSDFIWGTCADEHIPEERTGEVARVAGYVLLGFIHPEDVARELKVRIGIDSQTAASIEDALNKRIFTPIRGDIDKIYSPLSKLEVSPLVTGPKILQGVGVTQAISKPTTMSDIGWSKMVAPIPTPIPKSPTPPAPQSVSPALSTPAEPSPVILHQDTTFKASEKNTGFTLSRSGVGAEVHLGQGTAVPPPPARPAVLEFGGASSAPTNKPPTPPAPGAIHYTEFASGPRNVSQVAPASPSVPTPPTPPAPPAPGGIPQPPRPPQSNGAIMKDFL